MRYIALLRGINSGRNPVTKMTDLKAAFEKSGFRNVKTLLASGNVIFDADRTNEAALIKKLEPILSKALGFNVSVLVRTSDDLERLVKAKPYKGVTLTEYSRPNVTFLKQVPDATAVRSLGKGGKGYSITAVVDRAICTVIDLSGESTTPDLMRVLEKTFGKEQCTTRTWNTVERLVKAAQT
jgi:uncharacterized protein (DUF1697 family)